MASASLRNKLNRVDDAIVNLLAERFDLVRAAAGKPPAWLAGGAAGGEFADSLKRLKRQAPESVPPEVLAAVFREIHAGAAAVCEPLHVAFLGPEATFTHQAASLKFGASVSYMPQRTIADVFDAVGRGSVKFGVVPVENSTEGAVTHTLDMFTDAAVKICAELNMAIHHNLLCHCRPEALRLVYSHPQVLGQCRQWLHRNLPQVELVEVSSTTEAARRCAAEKNTGALASALAADKYGLPIRRRNIEDCTGNTTRFLVLGRQETAPTGDDKTSLMFVVRHRVGALYDSLLPLSRHGINLTFIESRPSRRRNWEYYFFVDFLGHAADANVRKALEDLGEHCQFLKILGSYPRAGESIS